MKPRFSFTVLPLALLPLVFAPPPMQGQCPCSSIPIPSSSGPESLRKQGCLKPAFRDFTVEYEADPTPPTNGGNPNLSVMVGDMEVFLTPGEKKRVRVSDASAAPGPISGEKVAVSAAPAPGAMYSMAPNAKVKVNTGGDSKTNNTCRAGTGAATAPPDKNTELDAAHPNQNVQNGGPQQGGSGAPPNSGNGGGNDPSQQGRGDACTDAGKIIQGPNNTFLDVPPRMVVTKTLGLNLSGNSVAGVLVWDSTQALDPSQASNYKVRGADSATSVFRNSGTNTIEKILAPDGLMILEQSTATKLTISNYKKNQLNSQTPPVVTQGEISFRTTAVEKLPNLTVNPPLPVEGQAWSGLTNVTGHTITDSEGGAQTQQRTVWTGTLVSGSITHYFTSEEILIQSGPARRILQTHSTHTANSPDRSLTSIEILQSTGNVASGVTASKVTETLHLFAWGEEVMARTIDPSGVNLTTQYSYHEATGTPDYGWLKLQINPDGSWEGHWIEDGANPGEVISHSIEPWKDTPATPAVTMSRSALIALSNQGRHIVTTIYSPDNTLTETFVLGTQIGKSSSGLTYDQTTQAVQSSNSLVHASATTYRQSSNHLGSGTREERYVTPQGDTVVSTSTTSQSIRMPYPSGKSLSNPPTIRLQVPSSQGNETDAISYHSSTSDIPPIITRSWTDKASGLLLASERLLGGDTMGYKRYTYDSKGRQTQEILMSNVGGSEIVMASTTYDDAANTMTETDSSGTVTKTTYDPFGRIVEQRLLGIGATAGTQTIPGGTLAAGQAQNDIVTIYTYAARPAVGGVVPLGWVETVTEKAVAINGASTSAALTGHSRTTSRTTDGAGRVISSTDVLGKILTTAYANVAGSGLKTTTKFGATTLRSLLKNEFIFEKLALT